MFNICVFCASAMPKSEQISRDCAAFADCLVKGGHSLVYGGASVGLIHCEPCVDLIPLSCRLLPKYAQLCHLRKSAT